ncbi:MAG: hypothetical protein J5847_00945 [Clostridia bacterium]|nr:hypothetical protein [Clostridia bacterium]
MKHAKKILAVLMALAMVLTLSCISAFATHKKQYNMYTFFGDSVTAAAGLPSYYTFYHQDPVTGKWEGTAEGQRVLGSYPDLIAQEVGINNGLENYYNESHSGWRTSEVREIFDEDYYNDDGALAKALSEAMANGKAISGPDELRPRVVEEIKNSDLITLDLGSNDVQLPIIIALYQAFDPTSSADYQAWAIEKMLNEYGSANEVIQKLADAVALAHGVEFALEIISKATITGLNKFRVNYPVIINAIRELNPTADIYVIGLYNPLSDTMVSENLPIPVGKVLDPMILSMNLYLSTLCPARSQYTYVDAFNTEVIGTINISEMLGDGGLSAAGMGDYTLYVHPSANGHRYIADQVLKAIPDEDFNGIVKGLDGKWAMYENDEVVTSYTGIAKNQYGWWRIRNGYVDFNANEIYKNEYGWWKTTDGKVTFDETGIYKNEYGWWRTVDSKVDFNANGVYKNEYGWWKCTDGKVTFKETGIFKNRYGKWYCKNSKVDFTKNGKVTYGGHVYKVKNGKVVG